MENRQDVIKAFREARKVGEKLLSEGKICWDDFAYVMIGFEAKIQSMGVNL